MFRYFSSTVSKLKKRNMSVSSQVTSLLSQAKQVLPSVTPGQNYKGQAGNIAIFGGSLEYTGAPYFAAISALRVGADLVHIFCTKEAAVPIKCYSPEIIVHPLLDTSKFDLIKEWLQRYHVIVIGPGLGRDTETFEVIEMVIDFCKSKGKPMVIDGDGLYLLAKKPHLIKNSTAPIILTPNRMELARLLGKNNPSELLDVNLVKFITESEWGENVTILSKGNEDQITSINKQVTLTGFQGSGRRCGGQGDILAGSLAVFLHWARTKPDDRSFIAAVATSKLVRDCNRLAFIKQGRSMITSDMIKEIHQSFETNFEL